MVFPFLSPDDGEVDEQFWAQAAADQAQTMGGEDDMGDGFDCKLFPPPPHLPLLKELFVADPQSDLFSSPRPSSFRHAVLQRRR